MLWFGITVTYFRFRIRLPGPGICVRVWSAERADLAGEGPPEGRGTMFVVGLESQQPLFELGQRTEVVGGENFSLNDRQVDLDLVEPTGMDRGVDQNGVGPLGAEPVGGLLPAMSRTIVHDPEDPAGGPIGRLVHDLADQSIHGGQYHFCFRSARRLWRDGRPTLPSRATRFHENTRARLASGEPQPAPGSAVCGGGLAHWSFHPPRARSHRHPTGCPPTPARTGPRPGRPWPQTPGRAGKSSCDVARDAAHRCSASATKWHR